jgi:tetratricopeptide (TPR) repeat protein
MERARLDELRDRALETCLALEIEDGVAGVCIAELEAMVADKPLRERRWLLLMTALHRDGRTADALRTYQRACTVFAEELGIDPGPELCSLEEKILLEGVEPNASIPGLDRIEELHRSVNALLEAGDLAKAMECLDAALDLAEVHQVDARLRVDLLLALGHAHRRLGDQYGAMKAYTEATWIARLHHDPVRVARAALGAAGEAWMAGLDPHAPALALLDEALELLPETPSPLRAEVLGRLAVSESMSRPYADADNHAAEALWIARIIGDPQVLAVALHARAVTMDLPRLSQRLELADELLDLALLHGRRDWEGWALFIHARIDGLCGAVDDCFTRCGQVAAIGKEVSDPVLVISANRQLTLEATVRGDYDSAEHAMLATREAMSRVIPDAGVVHWGEMAIIRLIHDRDGEFEPALRGLKITFAKATADAFTRAMDAIHSARQGDHEGATRAITAIDKDTLRTLPQDEFWLPFVWAYSLACWLTGDAERAADFAPMLRPFAHLFVVDRAFVFLGSVRHHLGLLCATAGARDEAEQHLRSALNEHRRLGSPVWIKLTQEALRRVDERNQPLTVRQDPHFDRSESV